MRKLLTGLALVVALFAGHASAATPTWTSLFNAMPNDWYVSAVDTVCSHPSWQDTVIPDGVNNYGVVVCTPSNALGSGVWVNLLPLGGPAATGWMLLRDEIGIWPWEGQFSAILLRGAGDADTSVVHYQVWVLQNKND